MNVHAKNSTFRRRGRAAAAVGGALAAALTAGLLIGGTSTQVTAAPAPAAVAPATTDPQGLTTAELADWQQRTATPAGRAQVISDLQDAFSGIATVGTGPMPASGPASGVTSATYTDGGRIVQAFSSGFDRDHFWIIASYGDIAHGAINAAVAACATRLPGWLCASAGGLLSSWANGWGYATNHGVWAAVYWNPPHVTGGRW
ncbi:hypothetical protein ABT095_11065 [Kitasatospora sp. NPDC002227]|uniref:hypothetical protein n=1 Tax=Kitasatospora sp. NPDC002227 TaxID=3154773 RepID=UPI0033262DA4